MRTAPIALVLLAAACSPKAETTSNDTSVAEVDANIEMDNTDIAMAGPLDSWTYNDEIDAITDARVFTAGTRATGAANDIEIVVKCYPGQPKIRYEVSGFNKDEKGSTFATNFNGMARYNLILFRADRGEPQIATTVNPQYNNQGIIQDSPNSSWQGSEAALGNSLTLRIQFANSNETYIIDQSGENFKKAVAACLTAQRAVAAKSRQDRERARLQAEEAQQPPIIDQQTTPEQESFDTNTAE